MKHASVEQIEEYAALMNRNGDLYLDDLYRAQHLREQMSPALLKEFDRLQELEQKQK